MSNDTQTLTLTEFLLARIAEDEAKVLGITSGADPDFFWGPDRIRAECEAKRRIVEELVSNERALMIERFAWQNVVRILAAVYVDHPDYRQVWSA